MKTTTSLAACCAATFLCAGAAAATETVTYDGVIQYTEIYSTFDSGGFGFDSTSSQITGIPKFDPALGTLTGILVNFDLEWSLDLYIESEGILNPGVPHMATATMDQFAVGVVYDNNTGSKSILGIVDSGIGLGCFGEPGDGFACSDGAFFVDGIGALNAQVINSIDLPAMIGTGEVTIMVVEIDFIGVSIDLDNVGTAYLDAGAFIEDGESNPNNVISVTYVYETGGTDSDGDGVLDSADNCLNVANPGQTDADGDMFGNACDADVNNDCVVNVVDLGALRVGFFGTSPDLDFNSDGAVNTLDLGIMKAGFFGAPGPSGLTNACDPARAAPQPIYALNPATQRFEEK